MKRAAVRLYRFFNWRVGGEEGAPFALCDACRKTYRVPSECSMQLIANDAIGSCQGPDHVDTVN